MGSPMGLDICPALWGVFQNSPQSTRTPQPQSQPPGLAFKGLRAVILPPSVGKDRINVCMNFRFHSVWCFGGQAGL